MTSCGHIRLVTAMVLAVLASAPAAGAARRPAVAALQGALRHHPVYRGPVDGLVGPRTTAALMRFQRLHGLPVDGMVGASPRRALGRFARHTLGSRPLATGTTGWDVTELQ